VKILILRAPRSLAIRSPAKKASYSAVLLVIGKYRPREISATLPLPLSTIIPTPLPLELEDPSTKTVHYSLFSSVGNVISARKCAKTCAFKAFLDS